MHCCLTDEESEALRILFKMREDFAGVGVAPRGDGYDVVLRLDGTYFDSHMAEWVAEDTRRSVVNALKESLRLEHLHAGKIIRYGKHPSASGR